MKIETKDPATELNLNLAPMIDVVFLLLIFFMVATTFATQEKTLDLDVPSTETGEAGAGAPDDILVEIGRDGVVVVNGEEVTSERMREIFARAARADPDTPVTIRGDRASQLHLVTGVMDACGLAGLSDVGIMTREPR